MKKHATDWKKKTYSVYISDILDHKKLKKNNVKISNSLKNRLKI